MRLDRLELLAYGPFTDEVLDLTGDPTALHLVFRPNEGGKSTTRRALVDLLFGIPHTSGDNHVHPYEAMRVGARLRTREGDVLDVVRRKGRTGTLLHAVTQQRLDEALLAAQLDGLTREAHEAMFAIDHPTLVRGGKALLAGDGRLGESLFSAGAGLAELHGVLRGLEQEADALFRPRATASKLHRAITAYDAHRKALREATVRPRAFEQEERRLRRDQERLAGLRAQLGAIGAARERASRLAAVIPLLVRRDALLAERQGLAGVPHLDPEAPERRRDAERRLRDAGAEAERLDAIVARLEAEAAAMDVDEALIAAAPEVAILRSEAGADARDAEDLPRLAAELAERRASAARLLADVRPDLTLDMAAGLRPSAAARARAERILAEHARRRGELDGARARRRTAEDDLAAAAAELDGRPAPPDTAALDGALGAARGTQETAERLERDRRRLAQARDELARDCAALAPPLDPDRLDAGPWPTAAAVGRFAEAERALADEERAIEEARRRTAEELLDAQAQLAALHAAGPVPSAADRAAARAERDRLWRVVRDAIGTAIAAPAGVPAAFEAAVVRADAVADQLASEAERVARAAEAHAQAGRLEAVLGALGERAERLGARRASHEREWDACWAATNVVPRHPADMAQWLARREALLAAHRALAEREADRDADEARITGAVAALDAAILELAPAGAREARGAVPVTAAARAGAPAASIVAGGDPADAGGEPAERCPEVRLRAALAAATRLSERLQAELTARAALVADVDRLERACVAAARDEAAAVAELARSDAEWEAARVELGLGAGLAAADAPAVLAGWLAVFAELDGAERLVQEIAATEARRAAFADRVAAARARLARDPAGGSAAGVPPRSAHGPAQVVQALADRVDAARTAAVRRDELREQLDERRLELAQQRDHRRRAAEDLQALMAAAGCDEPAGLPAAELAAARRRALDEELPRLEAEIVRLGADSVDALAAATRELTLEELEAGAVEEQRREEELRTAYDELAGSVAVQQAAIARLDDDRRVAELAEDGQMQLASIRAQAREYVRLKVAARMLRNAIERYRSAHQGPILRRANELFPAFTGGSFAELRVDYDDRDEAVLVGRRPDGRRVAVDGMSDGTREQLYLALRLAALERHVELRGPMPVVLDDALLDSDDERAAAILVALADLAERTQVLLFTHHRHLVGLAQRVVDPERLVLHGVDDEVHAGVLPSGGPAAG